MVWCGPLGGFQLNELEMTVIFVSTGVSTGLMVDKMMKVALGGLVVPLLPKQTQLQVQNPRLDVDFGVFIALRNKKKKIENAVVDMRGIRKIFSPINKDLSCPHPKKVIFAQKTQNIDMIFSAKSPLHIGPLVFSLPCAMSCSRGGVSEWRGTYL